MPIPNYLVIPDIHGQLSQYIQVEKLVKDTLHKDPKVHIIFLGDYIDRGESGLFEYFDRREDDDIEKYFEDIGSRLIVEKLFELEEYFISNDFQYTFLMGNHESNFMDNIKNLENFAMKAKTDTSADYKAMFNTIKGFTQDMSLIKKAVSFFEKMPYYFCDDENKLFFVHAGVNPDTNIKQCEKSEYLNIRANFYNSTIEFTHKMIFGHTPIDIISGDNRALAGVDEDLKIILKPDRIGLDSGNYRNHYMNILRIYGDEYSLIKLNSDGVVNLIKEI